MAHLTLLANGTPLVLDDNFSLPIEDLNPLFNDHTMYSYPVTIPLDGNRHYVRNIEDPQSDIRPVDLEHAAMQINVEGIPFRSGTAIISEDEHLTNRLSLNIDANEVSFSDLIADLNCRDVRVKDDIIIGHKLSKVHIIAEYEVKFYCNVNMGTVSDTDGWGGDEIREIFEAPRGSVKGTMVGDFEPQALGYSFPDMIDRYGNGKTEYIDRVYDHGISIKVPATTRPYINVSAPYGAPDLAGRPATYCNARVCYKHYAKAEDGSTADYTIEKTDSQNLYEDIYPYWVLDADRPQSGICFYVLYFLDCLFHQIGYSFDNKELLAVEDFKRLCFYTTHCKYDIREDDMRSAPTQAGFDGINQWLKDHGCGGQLELKASSEKKSIGSIQYGSTIYKAGEWYTGTYTYGGPDVRHYKYRIDTIDMETKLDDNRMTASAYILPMYANSDNFPDMSVTSLLQSLEAQFGIKFLVDENTHHVRATLLRTVFRDPSEPINLPMQIDTFDKVSEKITGVKVGYSAESDAKEQQNNIKYGVRDYDTSYDYCEYSKERTIVRENLYKDIFRSPANNDMHVYVDLSTGNCYRTKVDSEANAISELHPVLFEVGQYSHVEFGNCSTINEDYIHELRSDLQPVPLNDVNYYNECNIISGSNQNVDITFVDGTGNHSSASGDVTAESVAPQPILVPFYDGDMEHEFVEQRINNVISEGLADAYVTTILRTQESYDPTKTEDGNSPLQKDGIWGNAIAIMRNGDPGKDGIVLYDSNYDLFGNSKWRGSVRDYQISTDNITQFAHIYKYEGEQFSLKPRAYVTVPWQLPGSTELGATTDLVTTNPEVKNRGYADRFLREYIHFLLRRKHYVITGKIEAALLATIPHYWTRRFQIGGKIGYIDRITYQIDVKTGIRKAELHFFAI